MVSSLVRMWRGFSVVVWRCTVVGSAAYNVTQAYVARGCSFVPLPNVCAHGLSLHDQSSLAPGGRVPACALYRLRAGGLPRARRRCSSWSTCSTGRRGTPSSASSTSLGRARLRRRAAAGRCRGPQGLWLRHEPYLALVGAGHHRVAGRRASPSSARPEPRLTPGLPPDLALPLC